MEVAPSLAVLVAGALVMLIGAGALWLWTGRLRRQREGLRYELRRVLLAGAGKVEAQSYELSWWRAVGKSLTLPIVVTNERQQIVYINPAAEALFGAGVPGEWAIKRLRHHLLEGLLEQALTEGQSDPQSLEMPGDRQVSAVAYAWGSPNEAPAGAILLLEDVTELARLARARRDMVANLSHELRTPLASMKLITESLLGGAIEQPETARRFTTHLAVETEALIRLVEDLTALSLIESGRMPLRLERTDLRALVAQRMQRLAPQAERKHLSFNLDSPEKVPVTLDTERFGQVVTNLLHNAIKFSYEGGAITMRIRPSAQETTLTIRDEGVGIAARELPRIFERFYKGDRVRTRTDEAGSGIGLAIARHFVEAHGGTLQAESEVGRGATFTIRLPGD